jgi:aminoglycoside phosphotransferase (APT) family kinase protein
LEPFDANRAAASLEQLAQLHARSDVLQAQRWIRRRISELAKATYISEATLQELLDGPRGVELDARTRNAGNLMRALAALAETDKELPQTLVHGDCHAGNIFQTPEGPGLIDWQLLQRGGWALDIAYHVAAVLPVDVAEREEWTLLRHYLDMVRRLGVATPDLETAQTQYRVAMAYGFYLWSITRRVDPPIINAFVDRLGKAVMRHESYRLLGVS